MGLIAIAFFVGFFYNVIYAVASVTQAKTNSAALAHINHHVADHIRVHKMPNVHQPSNIKPPASSVGTTVRGTTVHPPASVAKKPPPKSHQAPVDLSIMNCDRYIDDFPKGHSGGTSLDDIYNEIKKVAHTENKIPVIFIYFGKIKKFQLFTIELASKMNPVIVISDEYAHPWYSLTGSTDSGLYNHAQSIFYLPMSPYMSGIKEFEANYRPIQLRGRHTYELQCITRWFVLKNAVLILDLPVVFYGDNDIAAFGNITIPYYDRFVTTTDKTEIVHYPGKHDPPLTTIEPIAVAENNNSTGNSTTNSNNDTKYPKITKTDKLCDAIVSVEGEQNPLIIIGFVGGFSSYWNPYALVDLVYFLEQIYTPQYINSMVLSGVKIDGRQVKTMRIVDMCLLHMWMVSRQMHLPIGWDTGRPQLLRSYDEPLLPKDKFAAALRIFDKQIKDGREALKFPPLVNVKEYLANGNATFHVETSENSDKNSGNSISSRMYNNLLMQNNNRPINICNALDVHNRVAFDHMHGIHHPNFSLNTMDYHEFSTLLREQNKNKDNNSGIIGTLKGLINNAMGANQDITQAQKNQPVKATVGQTITKGSDLPHTKFPDQLFLPYITGATSWFGGKAESFEPAEVARLHSEKIYMYTIHYQGNRKHLIAHDFCRRLLSKAHFILTHNCMSCEVVQSATFYSDNSAAGCGDVNNIGSFVVGSGSAGVSGGSRILSNSSNISSDNPTDKCTTPSTTCSNCDICNTVLHYNYAQFIEFMLSQIHFTLLRDDCALVMQDVGAIPTNKSRFPSLPNQRR